MDKQLYVSPSDYKKFKEARLLEEYWNSTTFARNGGNKYTKPKKKRFKNKKTHK